MAHAHGQSRLVPLSATAGNRRRRPWIGPWARYPRRADWTHCPSRISLGHQAPDRNRPGRAHELPDHGRPVGRIARPLETRQLLLNAMSRSDMCATGIRPVSAPSAHSLCGCSGGASGAAIGLYARLNWQRTSGLRMNSPAAFPMHARCCARGWCCCCCGTVPRPLSLSFALTTAGTGVRRPDQSRNAHPAAAVLATTGQCGGAARQVVAGVCRAATATRIAGPRCIHAPDYLGLAQLMPRAAGVLVTSSCCDDAYLEREDPALITSISTVPAIRRSRPCWRYSQPTAPRRVHRRSKGQSHDALRCHAVPKACTKTCKSC